MSEETKTDTPGPEPERPGAYTGTGSATTGSAPLVPKNVQRLATRTLFLLLTVLIIVFGLQKLLSLGGDLQGVGGADTKGDILALKLSEEGSQVVVVKPDGTLVESAGYRQGAADRDAVWNPSGDRAFFISDRKEGETHIFRWNPDRNGDPDQKSVDKSSRGAIEFPASEVPKPDESALVAVRGNIEEFYPQSGRSERVLPPLGRDVAVGSSEEGAQGAFDTIYKSLGYSFRVAEWCRGKSAVAAVMRRNDDRGEILLVQSLVPNAQGVLPRPAPVMAGERIEISVNPATGDLAFSVAGFDYFTDEQIRKATKNRKVVRPYRNAIGIANLDNPSNPRVDFVALSDSDQIAFGAPVISPDGGQLIVTIGRWRDAALSPNGLFTMPPRAGGGEERTLVKEGEIYEPSWSPDATKIVYVRREGGRRGIYVIDPGGSGETSITGDKGDFAQPLFSPQK